MNTFTKQLCAALLGVAALASCSRPVAYFQRGPVENHHAPKTEIAAVETAPLETVAATTPTEVAQPTVVATPAESVAPATTPAQQVAQANAALTQVEAYVRNDSKLSADKKLNKRMERVKQLLATETTKAATAPTATASPKKMNLLERVAVKRLDKQIKNRLAPEETNRTMVRSLLTAGLVVGIIGLILLLVGNGFGATLGLIALIVGLVLVLLDLVR